MLSDADVVAVPDFSAHSLYWSEQDVLSYLSENSDDAHLKRVKAWHEKSISAVHSSADDENASPEIGSDRAASKQRSKSEAGKKGKLEFAGLRRPSPGHRIQDIKEMDTVPVRWELRRSVTAADIAISGHCQRGHLQVASCDDRLRRQSVCA